jgi:hypothetical protein
LPTFRINGEFYAYRESPTMSLHLWQQQAPDVILLGSSMFFMNFNRTTFFKEHPDKRLIDMTMGNNTPLLSKFMLDAADKIGLKMKPGTIVLYGMNAVEFLDFYYPPFPHVSRAFAIEFGTEPFAKTFEMRLTQRLHIGVVKERIDQDAHVWVADHKDLLQSIVRKLSLSDNLIASAYAAPKSVEEQAEPYAEFIHQPYRYSPLIPAELEGNPKGLANLLRKIAPAWDGKSYDNYEYGADKVAAFKDIARRIKAAGGTLVLIKVPSSTLGYYRSPSSEYSFHKRIDALVKETGVVYVDLTPWDKTGIDDRDFIYPQHQLNPEHLNYEGADKLTRYLISHILEPYWNGDKLQ